MRVIAFRVPPFDNGTYLVTDDRRDAIVIDPAQGEREIMRAVSDEGLRLLAILNTHGHADHIWANAPLKAATGARLAIHQLDAYRLSAGTRPAPTGLMAEVPETSADDLLEEGPLGYLRDARIEALHTPGHTEGSTCFWLRDEAVLFSGDVLFAGNIGRVDLPGGSAAQMEESLQRVAGLPPETRVYAGHGPPTSIGAELPWLRGFRYPEGAALR